MIWTCNLVTLETSVLFLTPCIYPTYLYECLSCIAPNVDVSTTNKSDTEPTRLTRDADRADGNLARLEASTRSPRGSERVGAEARGEYAIEVERKPIQTRFWSETQT